MKLLDVPHTTEDMRYSVGITGVTVLKQSRYKYRHNGSREIEQIPRKGFQIKQTKRDSTSNKKPKKRPGKKIQSVPKGTQISKVRVSQYRIDKKEVTHRIRGYI